MSGKEMRIDCKKLVQGSIELYCLVMNSKDLRAISYVSRREPGNQSGYQRHFDNKRVREVGEYIKKQTSSFPNSIVVHFDPSKVRFESKGGDGKEGIMVIPKEDRIAWIIDGQHRLLGFEYSDGKEYDLIVAGYLGISVPDQATIFKTINSTQKGVSPSLIFDLISLTRDADFLESRAHEIVKALNEDDDSPWKGKIKMLGVGQGIISQAAFVNELMRRLTQDTFMKETNLGEQVRLMKDYFGALEELFPEAWGNKKYVLCKSLGVAAVLSIMGKVLMLCRIKNSFSKNTMKSILQNLYDIQVPTSLGLEKLDFSGKQLGTYNGKVGQRRLAEILENALPPVRL